MAPAPVRWPPGTSSGAGGIARRAPPSRAPPPPRRSRSVPTRRCGRAPTCRPGSVANASPPPTMWTAVPDGAGIGFVSPTLGSRPGRGRARPAWTCGCSPRRADTDLQATVSEVLPDGEEMFVQSGVLRASDRHLDPARLHGAGTGSHLLGPRCRAAAGRTVQPRARPRLPLRPRVPGRRPHPGGDPRPRRRPAGMGVRHAGDGRATSSTPSPSTAPQASSLVLGVVRGVVPTDSAPACPSLRGEPCRSYVPRGQRRVGARRRPARRRPARRRPARRAQPRRARRATGRVPGAAKGPR